LEEVTYWVFLSVAGLRAASIVVDVEVAVAGVGVLVIIAVN
jgi:hypothetical protein